MIDRPGGNHQPDLLVRTTNIFDPNRIPPQLRAEVVSLLKLLLAQHIVVEVVAQHEAADE